MRALYGPARVRELSDWGVRFTRNGSGLSLGREAGHSRRRIAHVADATGREMERALLAALAARGNIEVIEDCIAIRFAARRSALRRRRRTGSRKQ
ncbi:MAG: FAD-binding protein [Gemmatimonadota bacterium]